MILDPESNPSHFCETIVLQKTLIKHCVNKNLLAVPICEWFFGLQIIISERIPVQLVQTSLL